MKKSARVFLVGFLVVSCFLLVVSPFHAYAVKTQEECNKEHQECYEYAVNGDWGWVKTLWMLGKCDAAWAICGIIV